MKDAEFHRRPLPGCLWLRPDTRDSGAISSTVAVPKQVERQFFPQAQLLAKKGVVDISFGCTIISSL